MSWLAKGSNLFPFATQGNVMFCPDLVRILLSSVRICNFIAETVDDTKSLVKSVVISGKRREMKGEKCIN